MTLEEWNYFENHDMEGVKRFLARHGLYLEKGTKPMKAVVIRDRKQEILGPVFKD